MFRLSIARWFAGINLPYKWGCSLFRRLLTNANRFNYSSKDGTLPSLFSFTFEWPKISCIHLVPDLSNQVRKVKGFHLFLFIFFLCLFSRFAVPRRAIFQYMRDNWASFCIMSLEYYNFEQIICCQEFFLFFFQVRCLRLYIIVTPSPRPCDTPYIALYVTYPYKCISKRFN